MNCASHTPNPPSASRTSPLLHLILASLLSVHLWTTPTTAIPFSESGCGGYSSMTLQLNVLEGTQLTARCYINCSSLNITSLTSADMQAIDALDIYGIFNESPCGGFNSVVNGYLDLSHNGLTELPIDFTMPGFAPWPPGSPQFTPSNRVTLDLSFNLFEGSAIDTFWSENGTIPAPFTPPPSTPQPTATALYITFILSNNNIGPNVPLSFQYLFANNFICQYCGITNIPPYSFFSAAITSGDANNAGKLDLSHNDLRSGLYPYSFAYQGAQLTRWFTSILLNNCNLRTNSLPPSSLLWTTYTELSFSTNNAIHRVDLSLANDPLTESYAATMTPKTYLATTPNVFVDLPDGIFNQPPPGTTHLDLYQPLLGSITIGDFVGFIGTQCLFGNASFDTSNSISISIHVAPQVALTAVGNVSTYCPIQQLAHALYGLSLSPVSRLEITGYSLNVSSNLPHVPSCTLPPLCASPTCRSNWIYISVPTEPAFLIRPFYAFLNSITNQNQLGQVTRLSWMPPLYNQWSIALNRSDWMPVDMFCDLTFKYLYLPGLPKPDPNHSGVNFPFTLPDGYFNCLTQSSLNLNYFALTSWDSNLFVGRPDTAPNIAIHFPLYRLYEGSQPVPLDFFTSLIGHMDPSAGIFDVYDNLADFGGVAECSSMDCKHALNWIASKCPYIEDQVCKVCPNGYYPNSVASSFGTLYFCSSCPVGKRCSPYTDPTQLPQPISCEIGTYNPSLRQSECTPCDPGTYNPTIGSTTPSNCVQCPPGTANPFPGGNSTSSCVPCQPGTASSSPGVSICPTCPAGLYQDLTRQYVCKPCPANTYLDITGGTSSSQCKACPSTTPLSPPGSTSILSCSAGVACGDGNFTRSTDSQACQSPCPLGSACIGGVATPCTPGSYANVTGLAACIPCGSGYYSVTTGSSSQSDCHPCPLSTFSPFPVSSSCFPCPSGTMSSTVGNALDTSCVAHPGCFSSTSIFDTTPLTRDSSICELGAAEPIALTSVLDDGITFLKYVTADVQATLEQLVLANVTDPDVAAVAILKSYHRYAPYRNSTSLRLAGFGQDDTLVQHGATQPISDENALQSGVGGAGLTTRTAYTIIIVLLTLAFLSWPFYRLIPGRIAYQIDQFSMYHHVTAGNAPIKQPTQFGSALTWSLLWIAILVIIFLATASNTVTSTALVPPSSIAYSGTAKADFQITLRAYSSSASVARYCTAASSVIGAQDGFSSTFQVRKVADGQICSIAADCLGCSLGGGSSTVSFVFPYDTQFFEWELWVSSAAPNTWTRRYFISTQLPSSLHDAELELRFSAIESYYTDRTHTGDGVTKSGFEFDFLQFATITPQSPLTWSPASTVTIRFVLTKSDIMFDSSATDKLTTFQLIVSILTAIVSLFSIFGIFFKETEFFLIRGALKLSPGEVHKDADGHITVVNPRSIATEPPKVPETQTFPTNGEMSDAPTSLNIQTEL